MEADDNGLWKYDLFLPEPLCWSLIKRPTVRCRFVVEHERA